MTAGHRPLTRQSSPDGQRDEIAALLRSALALPAADTVDEGSPIVDDEALRRLQAATGLHEAVRRVARELQSVPAGLRARVLSLYLAGYVAHHLCSSCREAVGLPATGQPEARQVDCARCAAVLITDALGAGQRASLDSERAALARRMTLEHERSRWLIEHAAQLRAERVSTRRRPAQPQGASEGR